MLLHQNAAARTRWIFSATVAAMAFALGSPLAQAADQNSNQNSNQNNNQNSNQNSNQNNNAGKLDKNGRVIPPARSPILTSIEPGMPAEARQKLERGHGLDKASRSNVDGNGN